MKTTLFDGQRSNMKYAMDLSAASLEAYASAYKHVAIAWSGGKDSTAALTFFVWLVETGRIQKPEKLTVLYADTRMELLPLWVSAKRIMEQLQEKNIETKTVMATIEKRFLPYILGRGVPPPSNRFRWCTGAIKIDPMMDALIETLPATERGLVITGVRQGESAVRDGKIAMSCGKDGAECGQGWYQTMEGNWDKLAPMLHWRVCHVWEWLRHWAPQEAFGDWDTELLADAYGGSEAEEINARTGCTACPLASKDMALERLLKIKKWEYLLPLKGMRPIFIEMREPKYRLRKDGTQRNKDGKIPKNGLRMGPLTIEARQYFLSKILEIQNQIAQNAANENMPPVDFLNPEEIQYIQSAWKENLWPNGWDGNEPSATNIFDQVYQDGTVQQRFFY